MRFVAVVLMAAVLAMASAEEGIFKVSEYQNFFTNFMTKFKKTFSAAAVKLKLEVFKKNVDMITQHNANKNMKYKLAVNGFADLTAAEFSKYLGLKPPASAYRSLLEAKSETASQDEVFSLIEAAVDAEVEAEYDLMGDDKPKKKSKKELKAEKEAAEKAAAEKARQDKIAADKAAAEKAAADRQAEWEAARKAQADKLAAERKAIQDAQDAELAAFKITDWVAAGKVTKVKNQGGCGSCWSFGTIGVVESAIAIKTGAMTDLSEQQLVSCDTSNKGCNGGWYTGAFKHLIDNGVFDEAAYPYKGIASECQSSKLTPLSHKVASYSQKWGSDYQLFKALEQGPAAVAVDAGKLQFYASGLFYPTSASTTVQNMANALNTTCTTRVSHAVLLVGNGKLATGEKYWNIKNSWGETWGERGYFRMPLTGENLCGIHVGAFNAVIA